MRLHWRDLGTPRADRADGKFVELSGFPITEFPTIGADHFLMMAEPGCCQGCVPANRLAVVEIFADHPLKLGTGQVRVAGNWQVSSDPDGWRYQLQGAEVKPGSSAGAGPSDQASSRTIHPLSVRKCIKVCDRARR